MFEWYSFGRGVNGELGRKVVTEGVDAPGMQNADVHPLALGGGACDKPPAQLTSVSCGHFHCLAVTSTGQVLAWGANGEGQLGIGGELGSDVFVSAPARAMGALREQLAGEKIASCDGGRTHSVFVSEPSGRCFAAGKLPVVEPGRRNENPDEEAREIHLVDSTGNRPLGRVVSCGAGESHTLFVTSEGEVWSWLDEAAVHVPRAGLEKPTARAVLGLPKVTRVACGWHHTLALAEDRRVFAFGVGCLGQLGLGSCRLCPIPSQVSLPLQCDGNVVDIAAGFASSFIVTTHGWVYSWGANEKCQLGLGASIHGTATPKPVDALSRVKVVQVAAGFSHTACVTSDGLLYLWGFGAYGQLGFGFSEVKSSVSLGTGVGAVPLSATGCGVGTPVPAALVAAASGEGKAAGTSLTGHSRPWMQVWPRRCARGPFGRRKCAAVQCGAYHTLVQASDEPLELASTSEPEVLLPAPLELSDLPAATNITEGVDEDLTEMVLPPGSGLVESPKTVLRHGAGVPSRNAEIFRSLAGLFWNSSPSKGCAPAPSPEPVRSYRAGEGEWQRALASVNRRLPVQSGQVSHPLQTSPMGELAQHSLGVVDVMRMPDVDGPTAWDVVDEAVHRAFVSGSVADPTQQLNLARLVADILDVGGPELPDGELNRGLPQAPCRGLARMECLTPRPFYLPGSEAAGPGGRVGGGVAQSPEGLVGDAAEAAALEPSAAAELGPPAASEWESTVVAGNEPTAVDESVPAKPDSLVAAEWEPMAVAEPKPPVVADAGALAAPELALPAATGTGRRAGGR
mmetsp:Transcript_67258/g.186320  ORF Transcript_67258/g.186320 Transcript_67258/m.186320 type:complete len:796 (+) Transcript_67258:138-2525(+)